MNFKELLTLKPLVTKKFGPLLAKFATIIWYVILGISALGLLLLLGRLFVLDISGFIVGAILLSIYVLLGRIACEALANLKK